MNYAPSLQEQIDAEIENGIAEFYKILFHGFTDTEKAAAKKDLAKLWKSAELPETEKNIFTRL